MTNWRASLSRLRPANRLARDLLTTTGTSVIATIAGVATIRLLAGGLGPEEFGAYTLSRRVLATIVPISTLSMGVAIPRYLGVAQDDAEGARVFLAGLLLTVAPGLVFALIGGALATPLSRLLFHADGYSVLLLATLVAVLGYSLYTALYSQYRGTRQMWKANLWQTALSSLGPLLVALVYARRGHADLVVGAGAAITGATLVPLVALTLGALERCGGRAAIRGELQRLAQYGLPRVAGGFALGGLFSVGPFLAPHFGSLREAGYLSAGQSALLVLEGGLASFGIVALPEMARLVGQGRRQEIRGIVQEIVALVLHTGLFGLVQGVMWADVIVSVLLGPEYAQAVPIMRIVVLASAPYLAYVMLRSVIDAVEERAVNTLNLFLAVLVSTALGVGLASAGLGAVGLACGISAGFMTLGSSTVLFLHRTYPVDWKALRFLEVLGLNLLLAALVVLVRSRLLAGVAGSGLVAGAGGTVGAAFLVYLTALWHMKVTWLARIREGLAVTRP